ncbi:GNAT family N-acetyltransferase [Ligilactobacillus equi]|uniref:GNAT family acetyltransferase n=1 Tax=Ligilactobacillus equi DPC 6820 TaxID=1392007 RepID=V7HWF9_9LACO|nr:GNAT family N-acetyltransferase [Ligilactobacillus equi]ETA73615.1 GNAT family acetyltransferase [Ligilactobacillus equi DPC 6820]
MLIRPITANDDAAMAAIIRQQLKKHHLDIPGTAYFDSELDHLSRFYQVTADRAYFVICDEMGQVCGGAGFAAYDTHHHIAELQKLYLDPAVSGQGLSYILMEYVMNAAQSAGYQQLYLETHSNLQIALHLYRKLGFSELESPLQKTVHPTMDYFFLKNLT